MGDDLRGTYVRRPTSAEMPPVLAIQLHLHTDSHAVALHLSGKLEGERLNRWHEHLQASLFSEQAFEAPEAENCASSFLKIATEREAV